MNGLGSSVPRWVKAQDSQRKEDAALKISGAEGDFYALNKIWEFTKECIPKLSTLADQAPTQALEEEAESIRDRLIDLRDQAQRKAPQWIDALEKAHSIVRPPSYVALDIEKDIELPIVEKFTSGFTMPPEPDSGSSDRSSGGSSDGSSRDSGSDDSPTNSRIDRGTTNPVDDRDGRRLVPSRGRRGRTRRGSLRGAIDEIAPSLSQKGKVQGSMGANSITLPVSLIEDIQSVAQRIKQAIQEQRRRRDEQEEQNQPSPTEGQNSSGQQRRRDGQDRRRESQDRGREQTSGRPQREERQQTPRLPSSGSSYGPSQPAQARSQAGIGGDKVALIAGGSLAVLGVGFAAYFAAQDE